MSWQSLWKTVACAQPPPMGVHTQAFGDGTGQLWAQYQGRTRHGAEEREKHLEAAGHIRVLHCICKDLERIMAWLHFCVPNRAQILLWPV